MEAALAPGPFMQIIDVLRHQQKPVPERLFQFREGEMSRIRPDLFQLPPALVVKVVDHFGLRAKCLRSGDILKPVAFPQPSIIPECLDSRLGRHSRSGQNDDSFWWNLHVFRSLDGLPWVCTELDSHWS